MFGAPGLPSLAPKPQRPSGLTHQFSARSLLDESVEAGLKLMDAPAWSGKPSSSAYTMMSMAVPKASESRISSSLLPREKLEPP